MTEDQGIMGRDLIYLDNAATSFPKPPAVSRAMSEFMDTMAVNPGRSGFDLSLEVGRLVDGLRARLDRFFGNPARDSNRTVFTPNATGALNLALRGLCRPGDHVVATVLEHNSVLRPLTMLAEEGTITFDLAPCDGTGVVDPEAIADLLTPRTRLVVMTHASNVCGAIQPAAAVGAVCRDRGIPFLLDAAQSAGLIRVDMAELGADLVAFTGHKSLLGPPGTGGLIVGPGIELKQSLWGGTGVRSGELTHPEEYPYRREAGTLNTVGLAGLAAGLDWLEQAGIDRILTEDLELSTRLIEGCADIPGISIQGPGAQDHRAPRLPVVSLTLDGQSPEKVGLFLDADWGIAVRTGLQCAPLAHRALGTTPAGSVRFSFGPWNTVEHVDRALEGLRAIAG